MFVSGSPTLCFLSSRALRMLGISPSQDPSGGRYRQLSPVLLRRPAAVSPTSSSLETQLSPFTGKHVKTQPGTRPWPPAVCRHLDEVYPDLVQEYHRVQLSFPSQYDNLPLLSRFGAFPCPRPGTKPLETPPSPDQHIFRIKNLSIHIIGSVSTVVRVFPRIVLVR